MRDLIRELHDLWCIVTNRCRIQPPHDDPYLRWMREQERASVQAREDRRRNPIEQDLLQRLRNRGSDHA